MAWLSMFSMCWWRKNIIIMLLSLELLLMTLFIMINGMNSLFMSFYMLIMATIMVSGSSLGLSLLVSLSRSHNSSTCSLIWNMIFENHNYNFYNNIVF